MSLESEIIEVLIKHKVLDRTALIKVEYKELRRKRIKAKKARAMLADKHSLSDMSIQYYLYRK